MQRPARSLLFLAQKSPLQRGTSKWTLKLKALSAKTKRIGVFTNIFQVYSLSKLLSSVHCLINRWFNSGTLVFSYYRCFFVQGGIFFAQAGGLVKNKVFSIYRIKQKHESCNKQYLNDAKHIQTPYKPKNRPPVCTPIKGEGLTGEIVRATDSW